MARGVVRVEARHAVAREPRRRVVRAALREPLGRGEDCAPVRLAPEGRLRPEADQQDPRGPAAPDADDRVRFPALAREVAALEDAADRPAARALALPCGPGQGPALVDAYDRAGSPLARAACLDCVKLH